MMADLKTLRLDNASFIYPASRSKKYTSLYRLVLTLDEALDKPLLQQALETTVRRIPTFGYTLQDGLFWWHLRRLDRKPKLSDCQPLHRFSIVANGGFLFRVSADGSRIVLDIFHVLTDGGGATTFLLTLAGEYLRLRHGVAPTYGGYVLDPAEPPRAGELCDAFDGFSGKRGALEQNDPAYHLRGRLLPPHALRAVCLRMPADAVRSVAKRHGATVTEWLAAAMVAALQDVWRRDLRKSRTVLKVNVPVNLRPLFGSCTLRNFSSYVILGVDVRNGELDFDQILQVISAQKRLFSMPSQLESKIARNVELEENRAIACIPRFLKKPIIDAINRLKGDRYCSYTLSNLGRIEMPEVLRAHVRGVDAFLGRQRGNAGASACTACGGQIHLNLTRKIAERDFEDALIAQLLRLGIPVSDEETAL